MTVCYFCLFSWICDLLCRQLVNNLCHGLKSKGNHDTLIGLIYPRDAEK